MDCKKCGRLLNIKMGFIGTPVNEPREYYCACGAEYIGVPSKGELTEKVKEEKNVGD
jgi:hypothetical protein